MWLGLCVLSFTAPSECVTCTALAVVPIVLNVQGNGEWLAAANIQFTYHTLGNAPRLHWLHGAADCATSLLLLLPLRWMQEVQQTEGVIWRCGE